MQPEEHKPFSLDDRYVIGWFCWIALLVGVAALWCLNIADAVGRGVL